MQFENEGKGDIQKFNMPTISDGLTLFSPVDLSVLVYSFRGSGEFFRLYCIYKQTVLCSVASEQGLHCLHISPKRVSGLKKVKLNMTEFPGVLKLCIYNSLHLIMHHI